MKKSTKQKNVLTEALSDEWTSCLNDPTVCPMLARLREHTPDTISMPTLIHALIRNWDMCGGGDKIEIINECLGLDEVKMNLRTIEFEKPEAE